MRRYLFKFCSLMILQPLRLKGVKFGKGARIGPGYDFFGICQTNIVIGDGVTIGRRAWMQTLKSSTGMIEIGSKTSIGRDSVISSAERISIGSECVLSYRVSIIDHDHQFSLGFGPSKTVVDNCSPVIIGNRTFIGANTTILKGVAIGDDCVIGANSVVTTNIPNGSIAAGNPARVVKNRF